MRHRRRCVEPVTSANTSAMPSLSVVFVVTGLCFEDVLAPGFDGGCVFEATEVAQEKCNILSSTVVFSLLVSCFV